MNNIGNITYISSDLNGLNGLGKTPLKLDEERKKRPENLVSHFLASSESDTLLTGKYEVAKDGEKSIRERETTFDQFCAARRMLIIEGFQSWWKELEETLL